MIEDDTSDSDNTSEKEDDFEEEIYTIPVSDAMDDEYPPGDTLSLVDKERSLEDVLDAFIAGSDAGGADPDMGIGHAVIEEDEEDYSIPEEDDSTVLSEPKLRTDERIKQLEGDDEEDDDNDNEDKNTDISNIFFKGNSR